MKRSALLIGLVVCLAVVLAAGNIYAKKRKRPDLTIKQIFLTQDNRVAVAVKNLGPGNVPDKVWTVHTPKSAGVYLYRNGTGWGGAAIWKFDPAKNLKAPGSTVIYFSTMKVPPGTVGIRAVVDLWNVVKEANEGNNSLAVVINAP